MSPKAKQLQEALHTELQRLNSIAEMALNSTNHLNGLALNPETERRDLAPESTIVKEIATLLQHTVQNLGRKVGPNPRGQTAENRGQSRRRTTFPHFQQ
jgi:hypothetical protein